MKIQLCTISCVDHHNDLTRLTRFLLSGLTPPRVLFHPAVSGPFKVLISHVLFLLSISPHHPQAKPCFLTGVPPIPNPFSYFILFLKFSLYKISPWYCIIFCLHFFSLEFFYFSSFNSLLRLSSAVPSQFPNVVLFSITDCLNISSLSLFLSWWKMSEGTNFPSESSL